jgi:hypothetical protein
MPACASSTKDVIEGSFMAQCEMSDLGSELELELELEFQIEIEIEIEIEIKLEFEFELNSSMR